MLEPYDGKLSCTVLRGPRRSDPPCLPENPAQGKWLSRDPIAEKGSVLLRKDKKKKFETLYGFIRNDAVNAVDKLGLNRYYSAPV